MKFGKKSDICSLSKKGTSKEDKKHLILEATISCVRKHGFHAASMSEISKEAGMSVGIIYRYFANKDAIIEELISENLEEHRKQYLEWDNTPDDLLLDTILKFIDKVFTESLKPEYAAVGLEIVAEGARNPRVSELLTNARSRENESIMKLWRRLAPHLSDKELNSHNELFQTIFNGLLIQTTINPKGDKNMLKDEIKNLIRNMMQKK